MSNKNTPDDNAFGSSDDETAFAIAAAAPVYASSVAASNAYRSAQWYLDGNLTSGGNRWGANVDLISTEYTGTGVRVGIIDQGFDISNIDLAGRFDLAASYDPRDTTGVTNITPDTSAEGHGTWVAGVLGASADNAVGAVGVASDATLVGFYARFGFGGSTVSELARLLAMQVNVDVSNSSWGFSSAFSDNFKNAGWGQVHDALASAVDHGRDSLGTVLVFAAGNDRRYVANTTSDGDNTNNHNLTNSRFVITAAASTDEGHIASFSTPGASILVTAPGTSILTTARDNNDGDFSNDVTYVSGTSFSAPIVSGVVALMLEANPHLGYRDVQEILALSSKKIDPTSPSWATNGATNWNGGGNLVSHDFGFGLVDAHAAVRLAETWALQSTAANEQVITVSGDVSHGALLSQSGSTYIATVSSNYEHFSVDWVELDITLQNARNGDLTIELISPNGTDSVLLDHPTGGNNGAGNLNFTFSTTHNWGETPAGNWTVIIHDDGSNGTDSIVSYTLRIYGDDHGTNDTYFYTDEFATLAGARDTVSDASGNDAINAAAVTTDLILDLNAGHTSTIAGRQVVVSIGTVIENAFGGDGNDLIIGNDANNYLYGGHGHDVLQGGAGDDTLQVSDGDVASGGAGADRFSIDGFSATTPYHATITDLEVHDTIQWRFPDAATMSGAISSGNGGTTALDHVEFASANGQTTLYFGYDATPGADFVLTINGSFDLNQFQFSSSGSMLSLSVLPVAEPLSVAHMPVNDFNSDGRSDIVWRNDAGVTAIWNMNNSAVLSGDSLGSVPANWTIAGTGDFNGDGNSDLLWRNDAGVTAIWDMKDGAILHGNSLGVVPLNWQVAGTGDFNGDGMSDIVWRNDAGVVAIWDMNDGEILHGNSLGAVPTNWNIAGIGDFNGDGMSDLLWRNDTGVTAIWAMNDGAILHGNSVGVIPDNWHIAGTGDFNGDHKSDILLNNDAGVVAIWAMDDSAIIGGGAVATMPDNWNFAGTGDYNGDGMADLLWRNDAGVAAIWDMNNTTILSGNSLGVVPTDWHIV